MFSQLDPLVHCPLHSPCSMRGRISPPASGGNALRVTFTQRHIVSPSNILLDCCQPRYRLLAALIATNVTMVIYFSKIFIVTPRHYKYSQKLIFFRQLFLIKYTDSLRSVLTAPPLLLAALIATYFVYQIFISVTPSHYNCSIYKTIMYVIIVSKLVLLLQLFHKNPSSFYY